MTLFNIPRNQRTPETEVDVILTNLSALYSELMPDDSPHHFIDTYFRNMYLDEMSSGDGLSKLSEKAYPSSDGVTKPSRYMIMLVSCAYCVDAMRAYNSGRLNDAWTFVVDARTWCGILLSKSIRFTQFIETEKINHNHNMKKASERKKHVIYYSEQERFVDELYLSLGIETKTTAAKKIGPMLTDFVLKNKLPEEKTVTGEKKRLGRMGS